MAAVVTVLGLAIAVAGALAWRDLSRTRSYLVGARQILQQAIDDPSTLRTPEGRSNTRGQVEVALKSIASARHRVTHSPVLSALQVVPGLRGQRSGLLTLLDDSSSAATTGRNLLAEVDGIAAQTQLRDGVVPFEGLRQVGADARAAAPKLRSLARSSSSLWGPLGDARREFDDLARLSADRLSGGADAADAARAFMGEGGRRHYFVALQNNSEMRDQGAVLSYLSVTFDMGRVTVGKGGSVQGIKLDRPAPTPLPPGTEEVFGPIHPTQLWQSVNATADFAWSGRAMTDMYLQATGDAVDGVVAIDVSGLAALLKVVGPIQVPSLPEPVSSENVDRVLLHDIYEGLTPSTEPLRQERYSDLTREVVDRLTTGTRDAVALGRELGDAAQGGHLRLWSRTSTEEDVFVRTGLGGVPAAANPDRTFHMAVENGTATKLDYYVRPSVRQDVELTPQGSAVVRTTLSVVNRAPVDALPSYQFGPDGVKQTKPGDYVAWILLWGPAGSTQQGSVGESGLELSQHFVPVAAGQHRELTFETVIPHAVRDGHLNLRLVPQPRSEPVDLQVHLKAPGWHIGGPTTWQGPWTRTFSLRWSASR